MKKIVCLLLALMFCTFVFASCNLDAEDVSKEKEEEKAPEKVELDLELFTAVAAKKYPAGTKEFTVNVCDYYKEKLGETVNVVFEEGLTSAIGDDEYELGITIDYIEKTSPLTVYASKVTQYIEVDTNYPPGVDKPVIYLYPEEDTECSVKVTMKNGELTCTYPEHGKDGWQNFTARPDGTLVFPDGKEYYCLYWEAVSPIEFDFTKGFCVSGSDTAEFFDKILPQTGLNAREANEFIIYWLPILQKNPYNLISFQTDAYTSTAELEITPTPDSLLRVYMAAKALDAPVEIEAQTFEGFVRNGFTVVEWGGSIVK